MPRYPILWVEGLLTPVYAPVLEKYFFWFNNQRMEGGLERGGRTTAPIFCVDGEGGSGEGVKREKLI